jgi:hypothetical protein
MTSVRMGEMREYQCHIGHRLSLQTMIAQKKSVIEQAMSKALAQSEELTELLERALQEPTDGSPDELRSRQPARADIACYVAWTTQMNCLGFILVVRGWGHP